MWSCNLYCNVTEQNDSRLCKGGTPAASSHGGLHHGEALGEVEGDGEDGLATEAKRVCLTACPTYLLGITFPIAMGLMGSKTNLILIEFILEGLTLSHAHERERMTVVQS